MDGEKGLLVFQKLLLLGKQGQRVLLGCLNLLVEGLPEVLVPDMSFQAVQRLLVALRNLLD